MPTHRMEEQATDPPLEAPTAYELEERLRTDPEFREVCLFWAQFYHELAAADVDVSPQPTWTFRRSRRGRFAAGGGVCRRVV